MRFFKGILGTLACLLAGCSADVGPSDGAIEDVSEQGEALVANKICGGPRQVSCGNGQYCSTTSCGADAYGVCKARPMACTHLFAPVCGCDNETYPNSCFAAASGVSVLHTGACGPKGPLCGGIAGFACPGQGQCVDDPSDSCDPRSGGADCGGMCTCPKQAVCRAGSHFDSSPAVCACVPDVGGCAPCPPGRICPMVCREVM
jgi:hypothetical protein